MRRLSSFGQTAIEQGPSAVGMAGADHVHCQNQGTEEGRGSGCRLPVFLPACITSFQVRWRWTKVPAPQVCPGTIPFLAPSGYFYLRKQNSDSQKNILYQLLNSAHKTGPESPCYTVCTTRLVHCQKEPLFCLLHLQQVVQCTVMSVSKHKNNRLVCKTVWENTVVRAPHDRHSSQFQKL